MDEEVRPVRVVRSPVEGEIACAALREQGIKCACVEMPSDYARTSPDRWISAAGDTGMVLTVVVAPADVERAREVLRTSDELR